MSIRQQFGTSFAYPAMQDLKAAFESSGRLRKARQDGRRLSLRRPCAWWSLPKPEIADSMRLYLGMAEFMRQEKANAIAIDCLGGFARGELPAYPCVAFSKLNDAGLFGVCESDLPSTMTQLLVTSFSGMPGFVTDPVFDTSRNEVIHAHCVAATKLAGIRGAASPYLIRSIWRTTRASRSRCWRRRAARSPGAFAEADKFLISTAE